MFEKIVCDYLTYQDIESLRNTCRYLHHFTRDLRLEYKIFRKERQIVYNKVIYLFLKWARVGKDGTQKIRMEFPSRVKKLAKHDEESLNNKGKKAHKPKYNWDDMKDTRQPSSKTKTINMAETTASNSTEKGVATPTGSNSSQPTSDILAASTKKLTKFTRNSIQMSTNVDVQALVAQATLAGHHAQADSTLSTTTTTDEPEEIDHFELRLQEQMEIQSNAFFSLPTEKIIILRDRLHHPICKYHLQLLCPLAADRCADSHDHIVYNRKEIQETGGYLLYDDLYCFLSELFDMKYVWKYEEYIKELFSLFAHEQELYIRTVSFFF